MDEPWRAPLPPLPGRGAFAPYAPADTPADRAPTRVRLPAERAPASVRPRPGPAPASARSRPRTGLRTAPGRPPAGPPAPSGRPPEGRRRSGPAHALRSGSRADARRPEAPHLSRIDGSCLLLTAEGGTVRRGGLAVVPDDDAHLLVRTTEGTRPAARPRRPGPRRALPRPRAPGGPRPRFRPHVRPRGTGRHLAGPATVEAAFLTPPFTGVQVGPYATSHGRPSTRDARFAWFDPRYPHPRNSPGR